MKYDKEIILLDILRIEDKTQRVIMKQIVEYCFTFNNKNYLYFSDTNELFKDKYKDTDVILSLMSLCLLQFPLLKLEYEFKDSDFNKDLSYAEIVEIQKEEKYKHPVIAEILTKDEYNNKIHLKFKIL